MKTQITDKTEINEIRKTSRAETFQRLMAFGALIILFVGFALSSPYFLTFSNVVGILIATAVNGLLALGVTFIIVSGGIDLSVGTVMTLSSVMTSVFIVRWNLPVPLGVFAGIFTGALAGFINGFLVSKLKLPPFIATLGMLNVARGLSLVITDLVPVYFHSRQVCQYCYGFHTRLDDSRLRFPTGVLVMFGSALLAGLILSKPSLAAIVSLSAVMRKRYDYQV